MLETSKNYHHICKVYQTIFFLFDRACDFHGLQHFSKVQIKRGHPVLQFVPQAVIFAELPSTFNNLIYPHNQVNNALIQG